MALSGDLTDARRAIAAWPLLALLCGIGWSEISSRLSFLRPSRAIWRVAMAFLCTAGAIHQARGYAAALDARDMASFSLSRRLLLVAEKLRGHEGPVYPSLGLSQGAALRLLARPLQGGKGSGGAMAVIPWEYSPWPLPMAWGAWTDIRDDARSSPIYLLRATPATAARLAVVNETIRGLELSLSDGDCRSRLELVLAFLEGPRAKDPWIRSWCFHHAIAASACLGKMPASLVASILNEPQQSVTPWLLLSAMLEHPQPEQALALLARSTNQDPRRKGAWEGQIRILRRLGRIKEAAQVEARMGLVPAEFLW
jgi:hypothetical protein